MNVLAVFAALGSALLVALASVLQHRAGNSDASPSLWRALRHPLWTVGAIAGVAGFGLHIVALSSGALSVVQPLLVSGLLFAVPISSALDHRRIRRVDVIAAVVVVVGLVIFQTAAHPSTGSATANSATLGWCVGIAVVLLGLPLAWAIRRPGQRDVCLGLCAGAAFGVVAALLKSTVGSISSHGVGVLSTWPLYAFVVLVTAAIVVNQLAFNAGPLARSLPLITIVDPLVSVVIGSLAFDETVSTGLWLIGLQVLGFAAMSVGVVVLSRTATVDEASIAKPVHA